MHCQKALKLFEIYIFASNEMRHWESMLCVNDFCLSIIALLYSSHLMPDFWEYTSFVVVWAMLLNLLVHSQENTCITLWHTASKSRKNIMSWKAGEPTKMKEKTFITFRTTQNIRKIVLNMIITHAKQVFGVFFLFCWELKEYSQKKGLKGKEVVVMIVVRHSR